ncbi:sulfotransferase family protein [Streptomyces sp. AC1-42T]|uniref:sulfotransferase family protein n=1 Tax=Streptomyces sp. AC1-42T TaxID=2218665 RepID=UPI00237BF595|nr:sulfotransferase [Streptomyces sp. AC1-42T]
MFLLSTMRSGSTLLRCVLGSHSAVHAPHELHLGQVHVSTGASADLALQVAGLDPQELRFLTWDRWLHRELSRSGKSVLVEKTPSNVRIWKDIATCWPEARYIFLIRHPAHIAASLQAAGYDNPTSVVTASATLLEQARAELPGPTVRYEDLTAHPEDVTEELCKHLGLQWEPRMLDYGRQNHGPFIPVIGDWSERIHSGRIQPSRPLPDEADIDEDLRTLCAVWGY